MTITEFIEARIAEDEAVARAADDGRGSVWELAERNFALEVRTVAPELCPITHDREGLSDSVDREPGNHIARHDPARVLAQCEAMRQIVKLHKAWPVLVERPMTFDVDPTDLHNFAMRASQEFAWTTEQQYREHFGTEPPTAPMIAALAEIWSDHDDYDEAWRA